MSKVRLGFAASNCVYPGGLTKTSQEVKEAPLVEHGPFGKMLGQACTNGPITVSLAWSGLRLGNKKKDCWGYAIVAGKGFEFFQNYHFF
jgi:hypothetical protein